jgi:hypothetical protein
LHAKEAAVVRVERCERFDTWSTRHEVLNVRELKGRKITDRSYSFKQFLEEVRSEDCWKVFRFYFIGHIGKMGPLAVEEGGKKGSKKKKSTTGTSFNWSSVTKDYLALIVDKSSKKRPRKTSSTSSSSSSTDTGESEENKAKRLKDVADVRKAIDVAVASSPEVKAKLNADMDIVQPPAKPALPPPPSSSNPNPNPRPVAMRSFIDSLRQSQLDLSVVRNPSTTEHNTAVTSSDQVRKFENNKSKSSVLIAPTSQNLNARMYRFSLAATAEDDDDEQQQQNYPVFNPIMPTTTSSSSSSSSSDSNDIDVDDSELHNDTDESTKVLTPDPAAIDKPRTDSDEEMEGRGMRMQAASSRGGGSKPRQSHPSQQTHYGSMHGGSLWTHSVSQKATPPSLGTSSTKRKTGRK